MKISFTLNDLFYFNLVIFWCWLFLLFPEAFPLTPTKTSAWQVQNTTRTWRLTFNLTSTYSKWGKLPRQSINRCPHWIEFFSSFYPSPFTGCGGIYHGNKGLTPDVSSLVCCSVGVELKSITTRGMESKDLPL